MNLHHMTMTAPPAWTQGKQKFDFAETAKRSSEFIKQDSFDAFNHCWLTGPSRLINYT
jgi:hypothetical protein